MAQDCPQTFVGDCLTGEVRRISGAREGCERIDALSHCNLPIIRSSRTILRFSTIYHVHCPSTSTSHSNFASIFNAALESYKHNTKNDLSSHPLLPSLQSCDSPEAVLAALRERIPAFSQSQNGDDGLTKWVTPTVNVLYAFSSTLGQGVGLVNIKMFPHGGFLF